ncbi:MAG: T9SS type A sorting domain-containing protein [Bacteroidota bacterium]
MYNKLLLTLVLLVMSTVLVFAQITVTLPPSVVICEGESILLEPIITGGDGNYVYAWTPEDGLTCSDCPFPTASPGISQSYLLEVADGAGATGSGSIFIEVSELPQIDEEQTVVTNPNCFSTFSGAIDLVGFFGPSPSYSWAGPAGFIASTEDISGLEEGEYSVTVTNFDGCSSSATFELTAPSSFPEIDEAGTLVTSTDCNGSATGAIDLVVDGGTFPYTYVWFGPNGFTSTTEDVTGLEAGIYTVIVTDANGCEDQASFNVTEPSSLFIDEDATIITFADCNSFDGSIDLVVGGGTAPYAFAWTGPNGFFDSSEDLDGLEAGIYTVVLTDANGCEVQTSFSTRDPDQIVVDFSETSIFDEDCAESGTMAIDLSFDGGIPPLTFQWTGPDGFSATTQNINGLESGIYRVTIADASDCDETASFFVEEVSVLIDLDNTAVTDASCEGGGIDLVVANGEPPYTYNWTGPDGFTSNQEVLANVPPGVYSVTVTDDNGCSAEESWIITQLLTLDAAGDVTNGDCETGEGGSIDLLVVGGTLPYTFLWSTGNTTEDIGPVSTGDYFVTVTDAAGCSVERNFFVSGAPQFELIPEYPLCAGEAGGAIEAVDAVTGEPISVVWSGGFGIGTTIIDLPAGTYCATASDEFGCEAEQCIDLIEPPLLEIVITTTDISCVGESDGTITAIVIGGTPPYFYTWANGEQGSGTITNLVEGIYSVTVTDSNNCTAISSGEINEPENPLAIAVAGIPTEPCTEEFTLSAVIEGGVEPYSIEWEDTFGLLGTDIELVNPPIGLLQLEVFDANGCREVEIFGIPYFPGIELAENYYLSCATGEVTLDASASDSGPNLQYEWTGPDGSVISNLAVVTVDQAGEYTLTISNPDVTDCSSSQTVNVFWVDDLFEEDIIVNTLGCGQYSLSGFVPPTYFGEIIFNWTYPDGSTAEDVLSIDATQTGVYELETIVPGLDCIFYSTVFLDPGADACATVRGYVYQDINELCLSDTNDPVLVGWQVIAEFAGEQLTVFTDDEGYYEFIVPAASGTVTVLPPSDNWTACEEIQSINPTPGQVVSADFWFQSEEECPQLEVSLSTPFLRRCFSSNYFIRIRNLGALPATNVDVTLELDDFLAYLGASIVPVGVINQTVAWNIDEIQPGELVTIIVQVLVSCDAALGQVHCTEVFAAPGPDCVTSDGWSGTNLELEGVCNGSEVLFTITNTGATELAESVNFIVIEDGVAMMQQQVLDDLGGDQTESISFPANGSTYTFQLDQVENHPFSERLSVSVEGCGTDDMNSFSTGFVTQFPQATSGPNSDILCEENIGAYDPNDKSALPVGYGMPHYIEPETKIDYRIRFQNTGTDTAFTVVIRDTLSSLLDLRTLELGNSSHTYSAAVDLGRALTFTFNNILLPDSTTNLEASQGFVEFSIYPFDDAPLESVIENDAAIYFDFNEPIITNTVFHTLGRNFLEVVDVTTLSGVRFEWEVFPNPASNRLIVSLDGELPVELDFVIFNSLGQLEQRQRFSGNRLELDVEDLRAGWYHLQLRSVDGQVLGNAKLVKE